MLVDEQVGQREKKSEKKEAPQTSTLYRQVGGERKEERR